MKEIFVLTDNYGNAWGAFTDEADATKFANEVTGECVNIVKVLVDPLTTEQMDTLKPYKVRGDSSNTVHVTVDRESAGRAVHNDRETRGGSLYLYLFAASPFDAISKAQPEIEAWLASLPREEEE